MAVDEAGGKWAPGATKERSAPPPLSDEERQHYALAVEQTRRSVAESLERQAGLTALAALNGTLGTLNKAFDATIGAGLNSAIGALNGATGASVSKVPSTAVSLQTTLERALPQPENATERVVQAAVGSMAGAAGLVRSATAVAELASSTLLKHVSAGLASGPTTAMVSGGASAGASSTVREAGGSVELQAAAGLVGALAPIGAALVLRTTNAGAVTAKPVDRPVVVPRPLAQPNLGVITPELVAAARAKEAASKSLSEAVAELARGEGKIKPATREMLEAMVTRNRELVARANDGFRDAVKKHISVNDPLSVNLRSEPGFETMAKMRFDELAKRLNSTSADDLDRLAHASRTSASPVASAVTPTFSVEPLRTPEVLSRLAAWQKANAALDTATDATALVASRGAYGRLREAVLAQAKKVDPKFAAQVKELEAAEARLAASAGRLTPLGLEREQQSLAGMRNELDEQLRGLISSLRVH